MPEPLSRQTEPVPSAGANGTTTGSFGATPAGTTPSGTTPAGTNDERSAARVLGTRAVPGAAPRRSRKRPSRRRADLRPSEVPFRTCGSHRIGARASVGHATLAAEMTKLIEAAIREYLKRPAEDERRGG